MNTKAKKDVKTKNGKSAVAASAHKSVGEITSEADLKAFLLLVKDKMVEEVAPAVNAVSVMNQILTVPEIFAFLNEENKEIARDIWLRIKQAGFQLRNPPMLFGQPEDSADGSGVTAS